MLSEVIHLLASIINFLVKGLEEGDSKRGSKEFVCPCQGLLSLLCNLIETFSSSSMYFFFFAFNCFFLQTSPSSVGRHRLEKAISCWLKNIFASCLK